MKKALLSIMLAASMVLTACGGSTAASTASAPAESAEEKKEEAAEEPAAEEPAAEAVAEEPAAEEPAAEAAAEEPAAEEPAAETEETTAEVVEFPGNPNAATVVGLAWYKDPEASFITNMKRAVEEAGGTCVLLDQVKSADLAYDEAGKITEGVTEIGMLDEVAAKKVRLNTWHGSNAADVVKDVDFVIFCGGEDISPTLYYDPQDWHHIEEEIDYDAERDVNDYVLYSYCLDQEIPVMGVCRGMQMLSVVSGGEVIQDIPTYFNEQGVEYAFQHRAQKESPDAQRDYTPHDIVIEKDSKLSSIYGAETLEACPSWHHQAVKNVDNTHLVVTASMDTNGINIIEAVERVDKPCAFGIQFHPEAAIVKNLDDAANKGDFMSYDTALTIFKWIVDKGYMEQGAEEPAATAEVVEFPANAADGKVVGIAWRADTDSEFLTNMSRAVEEAGGTWVLLDQVKSADLSYDDAGKLTEGVTEIGMLDEVAAKKVRLNTWHGSNAAAAAQNVDFVIFTGGEDVSPTLYYDPQDWHHIEAEIDYNAERDVSDYLLVSYCLDQDIPMMGVCRGMQMLSVVSGGEVIQDIPTYFNEKGIEYKFEHRNEKETPESYRDYAPHSIAIEKDSLVSSIFGGETLDGCPSWHHQAVENVDNTHLAVTASMDTNGVQIIEAVERTDKTCAFGLQFHPEAAIVKNLDGAANKDDFMSYDTALSLFKWILEKGYMTQDAAA